MTPMDDRSMDDRRSERFGRYEILTELGRGAMGVVYKARDPKIKRVVAVKTVSLAGQPPEEEREYRERFFREAEAAGRLSHPGIVTIFDVGEEPETRIPYIVMEFVGGQSLDKLLSRDDHKLPVETALQLVFELAEALDCAHGQGVVHRDLTKDGEAHAAEDRKQRDTIEARNRADAMVYNVEKTLKEHRAKIGEAEAKEIESAIEETKKAMAENDPERTNAAVDRLTAASHKLAEAMYKNESSQQAGPPPPPPGNGDQPKGGKDDVVDAEFVDVDDKDKK